MLGSTARLTSLALAVLVVGVLAACGRTGPASSPSSGGGLRVVAAENFWGSIARQLAGGRASVQSIITDPSADPHAYQPNAGDARAIAGANMAIVNGLGYDNWASQLLQATPAGGRLVLSVGETLGLRSGSNPHRWYYPGDVYAVVDRITSDYQRLDPAHAALFAVQKRNFEIQGLARYNRLRQEIRSRYAGVPVGYSESIFRGLGEDLGLRLLTPASFATAIAEGTDVTAQDKQTVDAQAREGRIKVWVYNSQNVTPDVQRVTQIGRAKGIPVATVTETLSPAGSTFQQWQVSQLEGLEAALHRATGR